MESSVQMFVNSQLEMYCKKSDPIIILNTVMTFSLKESENHERP
jgi:hypothetical protein